MTTFIYKQRKESLERRSNDRINQAANKKHPQNLRRNEKIKEIEGKRRIIIERLNEVNNTLKTYDSASVLLTPKRTPRFKKESEIEGKKSNNKSA